MGHGRLGSGRPAPCALTGVAGRAAQGPCEEEGAGSPPPSAPRRARRQWDVHPLRQASSRARSHGLYRLRREAPHRRARPPCQSEAAGKAVRRPGSGAVPPRRARRRQAAEEDMERGGTLHVLRPPAAIGQSLRLRALPRGKARTRPPALCCPQSLRCLCAVRAADSRWLIEVRPVRCARSAARLVRAPSCRQPQALRQAQGAGALCRLCCSNGRCRPLRELRISIQLPCARASPGGALAAADRRDRLGDGRRAGHLRDRSRGGRLHRLRPPAPRPGGDTLERAAPGAVAVMSPVSPQASRR